MALGWRCFHCGENFTTEAGAREHFGLSEDATPACVIKGSEGGLVKALREAEAAAAEAIATLHAESSEVERAYQAFRSRHEYAVQAAEETGYARGLEAARREAAQSV